MAIEKLVKQTYRENIYATLREKIISGEILPGQTLTLRGLAGQFDEIYHLRELLECLIVEETCSSPSEETAEKLQKIFNNMKNELAGRDLTAYLVGNSEFHFTLYYAGNSPYLTEIINGLWARVGGRLVKALKMDIRNSYSSLRPQISKRADFPSCLI